MKELPETCRFQFHKGTIKTYEEAGINPYFALFQFHKGTIKTKFWQLNLPAHSIISIP